MNSHAGVGFSSSDPLLVEGFRWAKQQALAYAFTGDPVGDWYEAALPGREAFCMRDVAHQSSGAQVLGLRRHTYNMLFKFAANIAGTRDWCSYWEIDRYNRPCSVDYSDDSDFWYNLPANFDILACAYRQYLWTADRRYLDDPVFRFFYAKTVEDYVQAWDKDRDGIPEHYPSYGRRGIASYDEAITRPLMGGDLLAAQYGAFLAYAAMMDLAGGLERASHFRRQAARLRTLYEEEWWNEATSSFASFRYHDGSYAVGYPGITGFFPLYMGLIGDPHKVEAALKSVVLSRTLLNTEDRSYLPMILFRYGRNTLAYTELLVQSDPSYPRRTYPEVSYALIGNIVLGLMGIEPDASTRTLTTCSRLPEQTAWAEIDSVPVFENLVRVRHVQPATTTLTHLYGPPLRWRAAFAGHAEHILVDGVHYHPDYGIDELGQAFTWTELSLGAQNEHTVMAC